jgi:hypothetical protein
MKTENINKEGPKLSGFNMNGRNIKILKLTEAYQ